MTITKLEESKLHVGIFWFKYIFASEMRPPVPIAWWHSDVKECLRWYTSRWEGLVESGCGELWEGEKKEKREKREEREGLHDLSVVHLRSAEGNF